MAGELAQLRKLVNKGLIHFADLCAEEGRISFGRINDHEGPLFDLALLNAQVTAAEHLTRHAQSLSPWTAPAEQLTRELALLYTAETVANALTCFAFREETFGLTSQDVADLEQGCGPFVRGQRLPERSAEVARLLRAVGRPGADGLTPEQTAIQATFRSYAADKVAPIAQQIHRQNLLLPDSHLHDLAALGCFGLSIPERYGGYQDDDHPDQMPMVLAAEELSRVSVGTVGSLLIRPELVAQVLLRGATEEQKQRWLPGIARGEIQLAVAVTEPDCGSDMAAVRMTAQRADGGWTLNGRKMWCTMAGRASMIMVLARTDPDPTRGPDGLSLFMVEKPPSYDLAFETVQERSPLAGRLVGRAIDTLGYRGLHTFDLLFENYYVPAENLVGGTAGEGNGYYLQIHSFAAGRLQTAARALGVMAAAFEAGLAYAQDRFVFGRRLWKYPLTQDRLVRMAMLIQAGRQLTYHAAQETDAVQAVIEGAMAKLLTSTAAEWITRQAQQLHGGLGYAEESPLARHFVDARILGIFEGSDEVLALLVIGWLSLTQELAKSA